MRRAVVLVVLIALGLSGCENPRQGPLAVRAHEGALEVAVCTAVDVDQLWFDERRPPADWSTFWRADVDSSLERGAVISTDPLVTPEAEFGERRSPDLSSGTLLDLTVGSPDGDISALFTLTEDLSQEVWLHPDGTTSLSPCPN